MLQQRYILTIMAFLGVAIVFTLRASFSIAFTEMVIPIKNTEKRNTSTICPAIISSSSSKNSTMNLHLIHDTGRKFNWTQAQQGWILSSFYAGYSIGHIPALFAHKFSAKWMLLLSALVPCFCIAAIPFVLTYGMLKWEVNFM